MKKAIPFEHYTHPEGIHPEGLPALQKEFFRDLFRNPLEKLKM
jgi:uncharacterized protein YjeT (DUF2065 family)